MLKWKGKKDVKTGFTLSWLQKFQDFPGRQKNFSRTLS